MRDLTSVTYKVKGQLQKLIGVRRSIHHRKASLATSQPSIERLTTPKLETQVHFPLVPSFCGLMARASSILSSARKVEITF